MIAGLLIAATAVQASAPPKIVTVTPAPPPPIARSDRIANAPVISEPVSVPAVPVRVRVTANGNQLLNDVFRVGRNGGASYQESRAQAPNILCPNQRYYGTQDRYSLNVNLYLRDDNPGGPSVNLTVRWQRPATPLTCTSDGSREVQLTQSVPLGPGQSVTVQGDAGLAVTLSR